VVPYSWQLAGPITLASDSDAVPEARTVEAILACRTRRS